MSCREIGNAYNSMTRDMGGKLSQYYIDLQSRFGDPQVYAAQHNEMRQQEARLQHKKMQHKSELLRTAYIERQQANRTSHDKRMSKRPVCQIASTHQQSAPNPSQKPRPQKQLKSDSSPNAPSVA